MSSHVDAVPRRRPDHAAAVGFWLTVLFVLLVDQGSKQWVREWLLVHSPSVPLIRGVVSLTYAENPGLAFGLFSGQGAAVSVAAVAAACIIAPWPDLVRLAQAPPRFGASGLAWLLGGALGNLLDRIRLGQVVDFIHLRGGLVLNLADAAITLGLVALIAVTLTQGSNADRAVSFQQPAPERAASMR